MAANTVNECGNGGRSGAQTLVLLAAQLNVLILRELADGPKQQAELRRATGSPAQTTLRAQLKRLLEIGAIEKHRRNRFPGMLEYELTAPGHDLLFVAEALERWLGEAPEGPLPLGGNATKAAVKALAESWSSTMLRALAAGPLSLAELDGVIDSLSYPTLQRRLTAMRLAGQVRARSSERKGTTPYGVTKWLRQGVAPLVAAAQWERRHLPSDTAPLTAIDTEATFLLAVPLLRLPGELTGACRMGVETTNGTTRRLAGAIARVQDGRIASCTVRLNGKVDAWAIGSATAWLNAVIDSDTDRLELGGNQRLARALLDGLHGALFGAVAQNGFVKNT